MLRRIKEKARVEFHLNRLSNGDSSTPEGTGVHSKAPTAFLEEMQQQEASNDALRRQLELLRRLQLENNRFRQEARSLRERNEALKERDEIREREAKRLRDEVSELDARAQRDQASLATAAQTTHKLKMTQKKLTAAQAEIRDLQAAVQEAREARDQLQSESQLEISDLVLEVKRWKRNTKQLRQQEQRSGEEIEFYKKTIAALEAEVADRRSKLKDAKREIAQLTATIEEKTTQCESVETSAADCVKRMEEGMEALQKTHTHEREKRKKVESVRSNLQMQLERMRAENALLLDKKRELEQQLALFQDHWKERKQGYQDQLQRFAAQLEEHVSKHKSDAATIGSLREEYEALESRLGEAQAVAKELKSEIAEEAHIAQKQAEALRKYVERALHGTSEADDASLEAQVDTGRSCEVPDLQVVQAAISALRNETMNIVHEFQRARHLVRQQGSKLTLAVEHVTELEHLRAEDAAKMKELREQCKLAEQARDIVSKEKMEVLKWSEQNCERIESLEAELKKCGQLVLRARKEIHDALDADESWDKPEAVSGEPLTRAFAALQKDAGVLVAMRDNWRTESEKLSHDVKEAQSQVQSLEKEIAAKADEFKETLEEVERVHSKNAEEQKLHFEQCIADVDSERKALETKLQEESVKSTQQEENNAKLQQLVDGFEEDLPVFATILHLFVLVVQPLILQKENYEFQFQLDQQANSLKDMEGLLKKTQDLQDEMAALRTQTDQELQRAHQEHEAKGQEMQSKEGELIEAQMTIESLQTDVSDAESRIERVEAEKVSLQRELDQLKSSSIEEEEKADKSKSAARRQEEEVRSLKQAVKKAHDLYQKVSWQLEQEVQDKAALQTMVNHLRQQQEKTERELREEKLRELEKSFNDCESDGGDVEDSYNKARVLRKSCEAKTRGASCSSPTTKSRRKTSFAPTIDINGLNCASRRRKCENSVSNVSRQNECDSPSSSSSVSPLPARVHSKNSRSLEEEDNFMNEWQQLSVSRALVDTPHCGVHSDASDLCKVSPAKFSGSPKTVSWEKTTTDKRRRRKEIDKVNAAVHDYMDRIDDKLSKMYGIPPSSAIQRSAIHHNTNVSKYLDNPRFSHDKSRDSELEWETGPLALRLTKFVPSNIIQT
ncbi:hypothetical protein AM588_10006256 [Phytophthora nicotianae]|uniref:Uncharacterized protein n=1 Tax=Phytophthora nicotianae TaxID=4792 RepID=A0A0W8DK85_PHYNI|nr:hypothetical protein AM588_10006256 [Phytophthora nicotianae]